MFDCDLVHYRYRFFCQAEVGIRDAHELLEFILVLFRSNSSIPYLSMASRSTPSPQAKPCHSSGSSPAISITLRLTMPLPSSSIQPCPGASPSPPSTRRPPTTSNPTSTSTLGSVNGK